MGRQVLARFYQEIRQLVDNEIKGSLAIETFGEVNLNMTNHIKKVLERDNTEIWLKEFFTLGNPNMLDGSFHNKQITEYLPAWTPRNQGYFKSSFVNQTTPLSPIPY